MKILVLGSGAREHALCRTLERSPSVLQLLACPGNAGIARIARCLPFRGNDDLVAAVRDQVALAVVGSSRFIAEGTVDALRAVGIPVFGPAADAGRLETSKAFAREFLTRHGVPIPRTEVVADLDRAVTLVTTESWARVIKADHFAQGEGVIVAASAAEAEAAVRRLFAQNGPPLIVQEPLVGKECSFSIITDGQRWVSFSSCRDYKRAQDGDLGPTSGGMGSVSPFPGLEPAIEADICRRVVDPVVRGLAAERLDYKGFMSLQLMLTAEGPKVLEINARLGDPEAQSLVTRFRGDLAGLMQACVQGRLDPAGSEVAFGRSWAVSVVIAREGYPQDLQVEPVITGLDDVTDADVFWAGTRVADDGRQQFASGRLVTLTALGISLEEARIRCYRAIDRLSTRHTVWRRDIGLP